MSTGWHTQTKDQQEVMHMCSGISSSGRACMHPATWQWEGTHASSDNSSSERACMHPATTAAAQEAAIELQPHQRWGPEGVHIQATTTSSNISGGAVGCVYWSRNVHTAQMRDGEGQWGPPHLLPRLNHPASCMPHQLMCVLASVGSFGTNIGGNGGHWQTPLPVLYFYIFIFLYFYIFIFLYFYIFIFLYFYICILINHLSLY